MTLVLLGLKLEEQVCTLSIHIRNNLFVNFLLVQ